VLVYSKMLYKL